MKRLPILFLLLSMVLGVNAQSVSFTFKDGISNFSLRQTMEKNVSSLLSEVNRAANNNGSLNLSSINMTSNAKASLNNLWDNFHFKCDYSSYSENCLTAVNGYEIRGISVTLKNVDATYKGEVNKELTISTAKDGQITGVHMALANNVYDYVVNNGKDVTDTRRRLEILKFVEDFRSYYDEKDLEALRNVYSDDALIITGKVIMRKAMGNDQATLRPEIVYSRQNKEQYLTNLARTFRNNKYIKVKFDAIRVKRHPAKDGFYGVTLHQNWQSSNYSDDGYVFLLWQFREDENGKELPPVIHVRTWQPDMVGNQQLSPSEVFTENDFFIP